MSSSNIILKLKLNSRLVRILLSIVCLQLKKTNYFQKVESYFIFTIIKDVVSVCLLYLIAIHQLRKNCNSAKFIIEEIIIFIIAKTRVVEWYHNAI